jgi:electron transfer flavoprotein alpha subunit
MAAILAVLEQRDGVLKNVSLEVLAAARYLADAAGGTVDALVVGPARLAAAGLGAHGADRVFLVADDAATYYQPALATASVVERARATPYLTIVLAATALGRDLGPRVAARLGCSLAADVTALTFDGAVIVTRPVYSGKAIATLRVAASPSVVGLRPNAVAAGAGTLSRPGVVERQPLPTAVGAERTVKVKEPARAALDVTEATVVVSGGRGLQDPKHFALIEELAAAFGNAAVGASRAVVDAGWRPHGEQVGQTGKTVSPSLYIAVGISGAVQHLAGMRTAKVIVAINKDRDAPIFKLADYGIVGDLFEIVPKLTQEIKRLRAG